MDYFNELTKKIRDLKDGLDNLEKILDAGKRKKQKHTSTKCHARSDKNELPTKTKLQKHVLDVDQHSDRIMSITLRARIQTITS